MTKQYNTSYIFGITLVATLGGLLFGYDTAVISGTVASIENFLITPNGLGTFALGATVSSALFGCIIGGLSSGFFSSRLGRKNSLFLAAVLFFIAAWGTAFPEFLFFKHGESSMGVLWAFNFYRILGGIGVGLASAVCPMYIGEIAPAEIRGRLVSFNQFAIIFGMLVVYFVNWGIASGQTDAWIHSTGWRYMFLSLAVPSLLFGILLFFVPETPRYLSLINQEDKALSVLQKINGKERAAKIMKEIKATMTETVKSKLTSYGIKVLVIGILICIFQQFVGINVALYYAPEIFKAMAGDGSTDTAMMQTVIMGLVNVVFTVVAILTVDKWGRKPLLIVGSIGMAIGMFAISAFAFKAFLGTATLVFMIVYTASFMMSWGPICWVLVAEIFPNKIRGQAVAIAVACQWLANFIVSSTFPPLLKFNGALPYAIYGAMAVISAIFVWKFVPETKGKTLEEIEKIWKK
ncbi:MAG: D-xylose transporter XylE [Dysgonamonadaceae bacterium]|jgi:SP family xylose:H+ symportor-like MFS transporter|nr:D-xylose transporter XylE [Dysgonamonadaceae bacterium]